MRKLRNIELNIFIYFIIYLDVIMKITVSPVTISCCFIPCKNLKTKIKNLKNVDLRHMFLSKIGLKFPF